MRRALRALHLFGVAVLLPLIACAQSSTAKHAWMPGGGAGIALQGLAGVELHGNLLRAAASGAASGPIYQAGPELALGAYFGAPSCWGQRLGVRQLFGPSEYWAVSLTGGLENYTAGLSLQDARGFLQAGVNLLGLVSIEYGASRPFGSTAPLLDPERVVIRIDLNGRMLERLFAGVPIS